MWRQATATAIIVLAFSHWPSVPVAAAETLKPGDDIQAAVDSAPEGTVFHLQPGTYRQQTVVPKDRQQFIGQAGVVLNGALILDDWVRHGRYWVAEGLPNPKHQSGKCRGRDRLCRYREDLFIDGVLYQRVDSLVVLGPGRWFYTENRAYIADDPTDRLVELSETSRAFTGEAEGVVLRDLTVEKYASATQRGAIDLRGAVGWELINVTAQWNHGAGLHLGWDSRIIGGSYSNNGQLGIRGDGGTHLIEGTEIAYNNYAKYSSGWEAGGTKFLRTENLTVRNACIHHNDGPGLWTDVDNFGTIYEMNKVFDNSGDGIKHEISYDAVIRDNVVARNGAYRDGWLWGSQILVQNSSGVEIVGNIVETGHDFGNGISIIHQDRGEGRHGPRLAARNRVYGNRIHLMGRNSSTGMVADHQKDWFWLEADNQFDGNTYSVVEPELEFWGLRNNFRPWVEIREMGMEGNGTLVVERRQPTELACD